MVRHSAAYKPFLTRHVPVLHLHHFFHRASSKTAFTWPLRTARHRAAWSLSFWSA